MNNLDVLDPRELENDQIISLLVEKGITRELAQEDLKALVNKKLCTGGDDPDLYERVALVRRIASRRDDKPLSWLIEDAKLSLEEGDIVEKTIDAIHRLLLWGQALVKK